MILSLRGTLGQRAIDMPFMKLYIIRHLKTEWNEKNILQGRRDLSILPPTKDVNDLISDRINLFDSMDSKFELILTSSLNRTKETARAYGFQDFLIEPLLDELDFGEFEGKSKQVLLAKYGESWFDNPGKLVLGEPLENLERRVWLFLEKYKAYHQLLLFAHGSWTRALMSLMRVKTLEEMNQVTVGNNQLLTLDV